jgi:ABC-type amino acid transport substrate-binding protein
MAFFLIATNAYAQDLKVCVSEVPPFVVQSEGEWSGLDINIWQQVANDNQWSYSFKTKKLQDLTSSLSNGECDVFMGALTMTPKREELIDFSHAYFQSGLGIAVNESGSLILAVLKQLFSWELFVAVSSLVLLLLAIGVILWFFEKSKNHEEFGGTWIEGLGSAFWWSAVTMTTVGYGDKAPKTFAGRVIGLIWMFTSIVIISSFTASIASVITLTSIQGKVSKVSDLAKVTTGTVEASSTAEELKDRNISFETYKNYELGLQALEKGEIDAFVYDKPLLSYLIKEVKKSNKLFILPIDFAKQSYGIALPEKSKIREPINRSLLKLEISRQE